MTDRHGKTLEGWTINPPNGKAGATDTRRTNETKIRQGGHTRRPRTRPREKAAAAEGGHELRRPRAIVIGIGLRSAGMRTGRSGLATRNHDAGNRAEMATLPAASLRSGEDAVNGVRAAVLSRSLHGPTG